MMKALFIGRFQPFHLGHLKVIKGASEKYDEIIIGIGSSQYRNIIENPFTSDEREEMIKKTLEKNKVKNFRIVLIPDIHNPPKWVNHVTSIVSDFNVVLTNNSFTKKLFEDAGYKVEKTKVYSRDKFSGKEIRKRIISEKNWKDLVPLEVYHIIKKFDGEHRLKSLKKD